MAADTSPCLHSRSLRPRSPRQAGRTLLSPSLRRRRLGCCWLQREHAANLLQTALGASRRRTRRFLGASSRSAALVPRLGAAVPCRSAATAVHERAEGDEEGKQGGGHSGAWHSAPPPNLVLSTPHQCSAPPFWCFCSGSTGSAVVHRGFCCSACGLCVTSITRATVLGVPWGPHRTEQQHSWPPAPPDLNPWLHCSGCRWARSDAAGSCFPSSSLLAEVTPQVPGTEKAPAERAMGARRVAPAASSEKEPKGQADGGQ